MKLTKAEKCNLLAEIFNDMNIEYNCTIEEIFDAIEEIMIS